MSKFRKTNIITKLLEDNLINSEIKSAEQRFYYYKRTLSPSMDLVCARQAYERIINSGPKTLPINKKDFSYGNARAKRIGNLIHEDLQKYFQDLGIRRLNETTLEDSDLRIKARIDSLVEINGVFYLVEIKSAKNYPLHIMESDGAPNIEHVKQIQTYFMLLEVNKDKPEIAEVLQGRTVTKGIILYENKDNHKLIEFSVDRDESIINEIRKYATFVWKHVEDRKEPKFKFEPDSYECSYCPFYEKCHGMKKPPKEEFQNKNIWGAAHSREVPKF